MTDVPVDAIVVAVSTLTGVVIGNLIGEIRATRAEGRSEHRARQGAVVARLQGRLRDTRLAVRHQIDELEAVALGDIAEARRHALAIEDLDNDITLVGDPIAVRAWRDLLVDLRSRFGKGLPPSYAIRKATVLNAVLAALDAQDDRLLGGQSITRLTADQVPELFEPDAIANALRLTWQLPSYPAVLARTAVDLLRWIEDHWPSRR